MYFQRKKLFPKCKKIAQRMKNNEDNDTIHETYTITYFYEFKLLIKPFLKECNTFGIRKEVHGPHRSKKTFPSTAGPAILDKKMKN